MPAVKSILNLGSLNIDRVLRVPHIARAGETIASTSLHEFAGGKGANQSIALARAGARVAHLGRIGADGRWLLEKLNAEQVDTRRVRVGEGPTGQAMIQVDDQGNNSIVVVAGANYEVTPEEIDNALAGFPANAWLLAQNETSAVAHAIRRAKQQGRPVAFNPAPMDRRVLDYPLAQVDLLCVNETEGAAMTGATTPEEIVNALAARFPRCEILLTLGAAGAVYCLADHRIALDGYRVEPRDTTAAGDTFLGYFLASRLRGADPRQCLEMACRAAALCVTRPGAMDSIPRLDEVQAFRPPDSRQQD